MRHVLPALAALAVFLQAAPAAHATTAVGVSIGLSQLDRTQPTNFNSYHTTSGFRFRWDVLSPYTEMMFGLVNRAQSLSGNKAYVFDTSGLTLSAGAHWGFVRAGVGLEAAWLRQIVQDPATPGQLRFHNGGGFIVEPYAGVILPFLRSEVTELELSAHVPVVNGVDPLSIGPRVLLTMWLGGEGDDEEEEEEMEEPIDEEGKEPEPPAASPAPVPSAAPVAPPAKPKTPAKPKPRPAKRKVGR